MFVRWKKRISDDGTYTSLAAYLVQSVRIDGKPRQHVIAYLGVPKVHAGWWCDIEEKLHTLNLDEASREHILQALAQKGTRPSEEQIKEAYAFRERYPPSPIVPHTPPSLIVSGTTEEEGLLVIRWKAQQSFKGEKGSKYVATLAKSVPIADKKHLEIITVLGSLSARDLQGEHWGWRRFWYQVHCALCLAYVDRDSYHETMRLLSRWVKRPTQEELVQIIQSQLKTDEWSAQWHLDKTLAAEVKWMKKRADLSTVRSCENHYLDR